MFKGWLNLLNPMRFMGVVPIAALDKKWEQGSNHWCFMLHGVSPEPIGRCLHLF